ncbi:plasmid partition, partial [Haematococcus lacustris]
LCTYHFIAALIALPLAVIRNVLLRPSGAESEESVALFEGIVHHARTQPTCHSFRYPVRMALVSLDMPPTWFAHQASDHMTALEARQYAGTQGKVQLLTNPKAAGYVINPISVYYCWNAAGSEVDKCIAEVTNTPWGERVTFIIDPSEGSQDHIKKSLHVSPLMDMQGHWLIEAPKPSNKLKLVVRVHHPELKDFFCASLVATRDVSSSKTARNEEAGVRTLLRFGMQPQRIACWIYWHAVLLLWKGVPLYMPPPM